MLRAIIILFLYSIEVDCYNCNGCNSYTRIKRAKYYPSQPLKFYNRPPFSPPIRGPFSYTPPPGRTANDIGPPIPSNPRPYKVSKKPSNEGLGDEDLNNLVKYLSAKDLDRIVEYASEKLKYSDRYRDQDERYNSEYPPDFNNNDNIGHGDNDYESGRISNGPIRPGENKNPNYDRDSFKYVNNNPTGTYNDQQFYSRPLETDESRHTEQFSFLDAYIQKEIGTMSPDKTSIFTDSNTMPEEKLPMPSNLRHDDHIISYTNDVPSIIKPKSPSSYRLENFADLPLMGHENSKLHTVSSYNVPHYSVTASNHRPLNSSPALPSSQSVQFEPAPPASVAREQSDAHLKAIKIWTHKSKGTAYTLHDDGTLSLEKPTRSNFKFT